MSKVNKSNKQNQTDQTKPQKLSPTRTKKELSRFNIKEAITFDNGKYTLEITPYLSTSLIEKILQSFLQTISLVEHEEEFDLQKHHYGLFLFNVLKHATNYYSTKQINELKLAEELAHYNMLVELGYLNQIFKEFPKDEIEKLGEMYKNMWDIGFELMKNTEMLRSVIENVENKDVLFGIGKNKVESNPVED